MKTVAEKVSRRLARWTSRRAPGPGSRRGHAGPRPQLFSIIDEQTALSTSFDGWHDPEAPALQDEAFEPVLRQMVAGRPRIDLRAAAGAVRRTGVRRPTLLDVGCGSGYYTRVFSHLIERPVRYTGVDFSRPMIARGRALDPLRRLVVGDGMALPFADDSFDIVFSGTSLMHMPRYERAVREAQRTARRWCIFHTIPVLERRPTTFLRHQAYGGPMVELVFNAGELMSVFANAGLTPRDRLPSIPYNLDAVLGETTRTWTFVCEVNA